MHLFVYIDWISTIDQTFFYRILMDPNPFLDILMQVVILYILIKASFIWTRNSLLWNFIVTEIRYLLIFNFLSGFNSVLFSYQEKEGYLKNEKPINQVLRLMLWFLEFVVSLKDIFANNGYDKPNICHIIVNAK